MNRQSIMTAVNAPATVKNEHTTTVKNDYCRPSPTSKNDCCKELTELFIDGLVMGGSDRITQDVKKNIFPQSIMTNNIYIICHSLAAKWSGISAFNLFVIQALKTMKPVIQPFPDSNEVVAYLDKKISFFLYSQK